MSSPGSLDHYGNSYCLKIPDILLFLFFLLLLGKIMFNTTAAAAKVCAAILFIKLNYLATSCNKLLQCMLVGNNQLVASNCLKQFVASSVCWLLYQEEKRSFLSDITRSNVDKPNVTLDFRTGCDTRSFMDWTVHYIHEEKLKSYIFFGRAATHQYIQRFALKMSLDSYGISCLMVVTKNRK